jgi:hypothetical protein
MILWSAKAATYTDYGGVAIDGNYPVVARPTYAGAVLGTTGRDVRIMSDVWAWITYARVWDGTNILEVAVGNSEFGDDATAVVDATPEVLAAVAVYEAAAGKAHAKLMVAASIDRVVAEASRVAVGKDVTVVKGRKVAKGTTGRVFWMGASTYGYRVGLALADGSRVFTALSNVEVTNPDEYMDVAGAMDALAA